MNNNYLSHYGVLGMKWGVRRARRKEAKAAYKKKTDSAYKRLEREMADIEKPYKRGQMLSKKDRRREQEVEDRYIQETKKAKADYKKAKSDKSRDASIANRLYSKNSKEANTKIAKMSMGETLAKTYLLGSYGAMKYEQARARGDSTGKAVVTSILKNWGNNLTFGAPGVLEYLDNRSAR